MNIRSVPVSILVLVTAVAGVHAQQFQWTTAAGTPGGLGQANATGSAAQFAYPSGVAADGAGDLYIADTSNDVIRKIAAGGVVTTFAGTPGVTGTANGQGAAAQFNAPQGVAVDTAGNVYVADTGNDTIRRITPAGLVSTLAGRPGVSGTLNGSGAAAQFNGPSALTVQYGTGDVYVADTASNTIRRITPGGAVITIAGSPGVSGTSNGSAAGALFNHPAGIATNGTTSSIFIADTGNNTIRELLQNGSVSTYFGAPGVSGTTDGTATVARFNQPTGIAADGVGHVYVADSGNETVRRIGTNGGILSSMTYAGKPGHRGNADGAPSAARFNDPQGIALDASGVVYVANTRNSTIRDINTSRVVATLAGNPPVTGVTNGTGSVALFNGPGAVALDSSNDVFVADTYNNEIRISVNGVYSTLAGKPGVSGTIDATGTNAEFFHPGGIVIDGSGNAYVCDTGNNTIRRITRAGMVHTLAGKPGVSGTSNGTGSAARFKAPQGIGIDPAGNLYVADTGNDTIRLITAGGVVTTLAGVPGVTGTINGSASAARFNAPQSLVVDGTSGVYIADTGNSDIRLLLSGSVSTYSGVPGHRGSSDGINAARFNAPAGIAVDNHHNLFVADTQNETVREIAAVSGSVTTIGGMAGLLGSTTGTATASEFALPQGLAATDADVLYVADALNNRIAKGKPIVGSLTVTLAPSTAATAGAQWNVDGGVFRTSGDTATGLTPGSHTVGFNTITGFTSPSSQNVTITAFATTSATGTYIQQFGSASVDITPQGAINAGAKWNVDGGTAQASGTTVSGLSVGHHTINFTTVTGYVTPPSQEVTVTASNTAETTGTYVIETGAISVTIVPAGAVNAGAKWNVDGGAEQISGAAVSGLTLGSHTVHFSAVSGYTTPPSQTLTASFNSTTQTVGNYSGVPVISIQQPPGTPLASGSATVDFGTIISGSSVQKQFEIVNIGTAPLDLTGVLVSGELPIPAYQFAGPTLGNLATGGTATFTVTATPVGPGVKTGSFQIQSNDPNTPSFAVSLIVTGTGGAVEMAAAAGSYEGFVTGTNGSKTAGLTSFTVAKTGRFTGKVTSSGKTIAVQGKFASDGTFVGRSNGLGMQLLSGSGGPSVSTGYQIVGLSGPPAVSGSFIAWHSAYAAAQAVAESPRYTVLLGGSSVTGTIPDGIGRAMLTVGKGGVISLKGNLADGAAFSQGGVIVNFAGSHEVLVYDSKLYQSKGIFAGPITFVTLPDSDCDGSLEWIRPAIKGTLYPAGFTASVTAQGAGYTKPIKNSVPLPFTSGTFYLTDGGLVNPIVEAASVTGKGTLLFSGSNAAKISATYSVATGAVSGKFDDVASKKPVPFSGVLYQNANTPGAYGYFIGPAVSGTSLGGTMMFVP